MMKWKDNVDNNFQTLKDPNKWQGTEKNEKNSV